MSRNKSLRVPGSMKALRSEAANLFLEENAILVLANHPRRFTPSDVHAQLDHIQSASSAKELRCMITQLKTAVSEIRSQFDVRASQSELLSLMSWMERNCRPGQACYVPRGMLSAYTLMYADMHIPAHARISIDWQGIGLDYPGGFEIRLLEASLFEDMCSLFNSCHEVDMTIPRDLSTGDLRRKMAAKKHAALKRATMSAAFYFVEGYINCLATDFLQDHVGVITAKEKVLLTEWDETLRRYRPISTRDKLVQYPRIITRSQFPPLDENNCPELEYFVTAAKEFRDAVVHASPALDPQKEIPWKETVFGSLSQQDVDKIVDTAVALVARIETLVHGKTPLWLQTRDVETGLFPDSVFE